MKQKENESTFDYYMRLEKQTKILNYASIIMMFLSIILLLIMVVFL